jgi:hypothetical protein
VARPVLSDTSFGALVDPPPDSDRFESPEPLESLEPREPDDSLEPPEPPDPLDPPDAPDVVSRGPPPAPPSFACVAGAPFADDPPELDRRSTFAQPEPLKRIDGAEKAFFIEPSVPHTGQNVGPGSLMPWITSVRLPQAEQV